MYAWETYIHMGHFLIISDLLDKIIYIYFLNFNESSLLVSWFHSLNYALIFWHALVGLCSIFLCVDSSHIWSGVCVVYANSYMMSP